jgi:hypothetical protein
MTTHGDVKKPDDACFECPGQADHSLWALKAFLSEVAIRYHSSFKLSPTYIQGLEDVPLTEDRLSRHNPQINWSAKKR